jgi:hypothetical protein
MIMQNEGFKEYLEGKKIDTKVIEKSLQRKENTFDNYVALLRYGLFTEDENLIIPSMEHLDGSEMFPNFSKRLIDEYNEKTRNEIFGDLDVPPLGLHPKERPVYTKNLVERFIQKFGEEESIKFFAIGLRDKYTESYKQSRENYLKAPSIDDFLDQKHIKFMKTLKEHEIEKSLFFTQRIDKSVIEYVERDPTIESGVRNGKVVTITKIPYMTIPYLKAKTKKERTYYFCHNPMIREALLDEEQPVSPIFCNCSGGYYKNYWEAVLDQPVEVELLESVIKGDNVCRFALHLPESIVRN